MKLTKNGLRATKKIPMSNDRTNITPKYGVQHLTEPSYWNTCIHTTTSSAVAIVTYKTQICANATEEHKRCVSNVLVEEVAERRYTYNMTS